jgi:hypothetical protein
VLVQCRPDLAICHRTLLSTGRFRRRRESGHARPLIDRRGSVEGRNSSARTLLVLLRGDRAGDAATALDRASSAYRQPTSNPDRGEALRNSGGSRWMIDDADDVTAREPRAGRDDCLSDRIPIDRLVGSIHAVKRDQRAQPVAYGHADRHIELPRLYDCGVHYRTCFRQTQSHVDTRSRCCACFWRG